MEAGSAGGTDDCDKCGVRVGYMGMGTARLWDIQGHLEMVRLKEVNNGYTDENCNRW